LVAIADDKNEAFALIVADGTLRHQDCIVHHTAAHAYRHEHPWNETAIGILETRASADTAGAGVNPVIEAVNVTTINTPLTAAAHDVDRDLFLLQLRLAVIANVIQISLLIDFEIGIDSII